jgi:hypothetical protein
MTTDTIKNSARIEFTLEDANTLMSLVDIALKAGGLQVATQAVYIQSKVNKAFTEKASPPLSPPPPIADTPSPAPKRKQPVQPAVQVDQA